jgi:hypothetical protein
MRKFLATLAVLTFSATPVFAQSFCTCDGTGNVLKFTNNPITFQNKAPTITAMAPSGLDAFAMAPMHRNAPFNANDPKTAGGGSLGYNETLHIF